MHFDFDKPIDRRGTDSIKFDFAAEHGYDPNILPLWVADMDFQAPPCVLEALQKRVDHGIFGYTDTKEDYFEAVASWFSRRFDWQLQPSWLVKTPGVVFALSAAVRVMTQPGDAVLVQPPVYSPFYNVIVRNDRRVVENPLVYENGKYTIDFADFEEKLRANSVKLFILCSPHNPVCRVWTEAELRRIGELCEKYGVQVIADEIHCDFTLPGFTHTPFLKACPQLAEQCIVCTAPSKTFNLAGLQVSNLFIPGEELRAAFTRELDRICYHSLNCMGSTACRAAYTEGEPWLEACKAYMLENLNFVRSVLAENLPAIRLVEPEGTYFAWLDCSGLGLTPEQLEDLIVNTAGLWLDSGAIFGACAAQFQRVVLACPRKTVEEAMQRLLRAVQM